MSYLSAVRRAAAEYPFGPSFLARFEGVSEDELRNLQERRFADVVRTAWRTAFYRRHWGAHGVEQGDIRSLDDLSALPVFDKADIMAGVERDPPFGELATLVGGACRQRILHTTSGTTGRPQPVVWGPFGREAQNALLARMYRWAGLRSTDVVHSVYGHGLVNGGHYVREAVVHFTGATFLSAGTGLETRSEQQVALMAEYGATVLLGFADYLRKLGELAHERGLAIPARLVIGHLPAEERAGLEQAWGGARSYDWYGVADTGIVAGEGPDRDGLYVWEDAHVVEVLDTDTGQPLPIGSRGDLVVTSLAKHDLAPLVRFNTHDVSAFRPGRGAIDIPFRRIEGFRGRSDNMVKLRGINVFPHAVGALLVDRAGLTGEYYCRLERRHDGADELVVVVEHAGRGDAGELADDLSASLGVRVLVELVPPGATADTTGIDTRQKPIRLLDTRCTTT